MLNQRNEAVAMYGPQNARSCDCIQVKLCLVKFAYFSVNLFKSQEKSRITEIFSMVIMILKVN